MVDRHLTISRGTSVVHCTEKIFLTNQFLNTGLQRAVVSSKNPKKILKNTIYKDIDRILFLWWTFGATIIVDNITIKVDCQSL